MNDLSNKQSSAPQLSRARAFLFGALAFVWFPKMVQWGSLASTGGWQNIWKEFPVDASQLATVLLITHAIRAVAKSAFGVMAVFGFIPLLVGWALYAAFFRSSKLKKRQEAYA